jgi:CheY-like chemotaxis protein
MNKSNEVLRSLRKAREEARKLPAHLATAQRVARLGTWEWDLGAREMVWSKQLYRLLGREPETSVPSFETFLASIHPEDRQRVHAGLLKAGSTGQAYRIEFRVTVGGARPRAILAHIEVGRDPDGRTRRLIGSALDISELRWEEELMRRARPARGPRGGDRPGDLHKANGTPPMTTAGEDSEGHGTEDRIGSGGPHAGAAFDWREFQEIASLDRLYGLFSIRERLGYQGGGVELQGGPGGVGLPAPSDAVTFSLGAEPHSGGGADASVRKAERHEVAAAPTGSPRAIRLLVVDDHAVLRQGLVHLLQEESGIEVVGEAADGEEAVRLASELRPDVVLMDVTMPRLDGVEATLLIVAANPGIRVIGLSMHEDAAMAAAMLRSGAVTYLTKGGSAKDLIAAIRAGRPSR